MTMYHTTNYESSLTALTLHNSLIKTHQRIPGLSEMLSDLLSQLMVWFFYNVLRSNCSIFKVYDHEKRQ
jgi:hypothetical protein